MADPALRPPTVSGSPHAPDASTAPGPSRVARATPRPRVLPVGWGVPVSCVALASVCALLLSAPAAPLRGALREVLSAPGAARTPPPAADAVPPPPDSTSPGPAPVPAHPQPAPAPDRPVVPTTLRFAPPGAAQTLEERYLAYLALLGDALLTLDPAPLGAVAAGPALADLTAELEARRREERPARLAVYDDSLVLYRDVRDAPTLLVSYLDATAPVDPRTGRALPRPQPPEIVRETLRFETLDGTLKITARERQPIAYLRPAVDLPAGQPGAAEAIPLLERLDAVLAEAELTGDPGRLPEVLHGEPLRGLTVPIVAGGRTPFVKHLAWHQAILDPATAAEGMGLIVDEVYRDETFWIDRRTGLRLPSQTPIYRRRVLRFEPVDGAWKCVQWWPERLGPPIE